MSDEPQETIVIPVQEAFPSARIILRNYQEFDQQTRCAALNVLAHSSLSYDQQLLQDTVDQILADETSENATGVITWLAICFIASMALGLWIGDTVKAWAIQDASTQEEIL